MSAEVRFGIIGCGLMGREFASVSMRWLHLTGDLPRPVIVAACDASPERLAWFERVPDTRYFYQDYRELLKNPEVEAVYCAVPHNLHAQVYSDVIRAGKHLLGESPLAWTWRVLKRSRLPWRSARRCSCAAPASFPTIPPCSRW